MKRTLVLTPMVEERFHLACALEELGHVRRVDSVGRLDAWSFPRLGALLAVGGHGKTQFGVQATHLLHHLPDVKLVVCAGAAGSLASHVGVGDLVAATDTVEHDYTLRFDRRPLPRFPGDSAALTHLTSLTPVGYRLYVGPVASGDEDVMDGVRAGDIAERTGALCVAWEGAGGARACHFAGVPFVELRAVTDQADKSAPVDFETNLALAMANLA